MPAMIVVDPYFPDSPAAFGQWLEVHHAKLTEKWIGFHKKATGRPSLSWQESVIEALCWGWIDGIRKSHGADGFVIRFTPRKPTSIWSDINTQFVKRLIKEGRMQPAGLAAYKKRDAKKSGVYSFERKTPAAFSDAEIRQFKRRKTAWAAWVACPPGYKRTCLHWVTSAKRPETRAQRLERLIKSCVDGKRIF